MPSIAIVGYTNAGKSSLLNALTGAGVLVQDALFATLEPTTRRGQFDDGRPFVVSDTVGFVRHLPTQLVEAFRSTLEEVVDADLLVHVVDGSDVNPLAQISAVRQVIIRSAAPTIDGDPAPELIVVNKIDAASGLGLAKLRRALPGAMFVSARTGDGVDALRRRMAELAVPTDTAVDVVIPYDRGDLVVPRARRRPGAGDRAQQRRHPDQGAGAGGAGRQPARVLGDLKRLQITEGAGAPTPAPSTFLSRADRQSGRRRARPPGRRGRSAAAASCPGGGELAVAAVTAPGRLSTGGDARPPR